LAQLAAEVPAAPCLLINEDGMEVGVFAPSSCILTIPLLDRLMEEAMETWASEERIAAAEAQPA
jgi:hypothetical protein